MTFRRHHFHAVMFAAALATVAFASPHAFAQSGGEHGGGKSGGYWQEGPSELRGTGCREDEPCPQEETQPAAGSGFHHPANRSGGYWKEGPSEKRR